MSTPTDPLPPDVVDELLSADLDGEFDAAALDHGLSPQAARAALDALPTTTARRDELARAQQVSAGEPVSLGELDRERLVRAATRTDEHIPRRTARAPRWRGALVGAAVLAAVAAVAGGVALTNRGSTSTSKSSGPTAPVAANAAGPQTAGRALVDLGPVTNTDSLHAAVLRAAAPTSSTQTFAPVPSTSTASNGSTAAPARCLARLGAPAGARGLALVGVATYRGQPVSVATATDGRDTLGWAFDAATCRIELFYSARN